MRIFHRFVQSIVLTSQAIVAAFQFLSRIPIPISVPFHGAVCRRSLLFFPFVGLVLGIIVSFAAWGLSLLFPPIVTAVLVLLVWIAFSGGLHLDGWMDTADGMLSHRSKERILEIMRDSRVGAMGAIAAVFALLLKAAVVTSMIEEGITPFVFLLVIIPAFSRLAMVWAIAGWPYVRKNGIGSLYQGTTWSHAVGAAAVTALLAAIFNIIYVSIDWSLFIRQLALMLVVTIAVSSFIAALFTRKLGGMTGDTYGFLNEAMELLLLLAAWLIAA